MITVGVTGAGGGVGGAVLRSLKQSALEFTIIGMDMDPYASGLYFSNISYLIPEAAAANYRDVLLSVCEREKVQALFIGTDPELIPVSLMVDSLDKLGCVPICSSIIVNEIARDKLLCAKILRDAGFPFARTVAMGEFDALSQETGFPIVVKPVGGSASRGVRMVFGREEALECGVDGLIAQKYLLSIEWNKKKNELQKHEVYSNHAIIQRDEISIQVLVAVDGTVIDTFTSRNVLKDGVPIIIQPIEHDESGATGIAVAMASFLAAMGMRGPCNFQCKLTENGPFFYEINPRFTGITAVRNSMDFCEVEACIRNFVLGESVEQVKATCLNTKFDLICSRYVTEYMVPTDDVEKIKESGKCAGSGWSVYL